MPLHKVHIDLIRRIAGERSCFVCRGIFSAIKHTRATASAALVSQHRRRSLRVRLDRAPRADRPEMRGSRCQLLQLQMLLHCGCSTCSLGSTEEGTEGRVIARQIYRAGTNTHIVM